MGNDFTADALPQAAQTADSRNCRTVEQEETLTVQAPGLPGLAELTLFLGSVSDALCTLDRPRDCIVEGPTGSGKICIDGFDVAVLETDVAMAGATCRVTCSVRPVEGMSGFLSAFAEQFDGRLGIAWHDGWPILSVEGVANPTVAAAGGEAIPSSQSPAICSACDRRADHPEVRSCTRRDCPMCERRAA